MGDFKGHVQYGMVVMFLGTWWTYSALRRYFLCKYLQHPNYKYRNTATYPFPYFLTRTPIEAWLKIVIAFIAGLVGFVTTVGVGPGLIPAWSFQHIMIDVFFILSGMTDLLKHYCPQVIPRHTDHAALALTFYMKYWTFSNHMHGKSILENMVHGFFLPLDQATAIALLFEVFCNKSVVPALVRGVTTFISGTWLIQVAFILFPPSGIVLYDDNDHNSLGLVSGIYTAHYVGATLYLYALMFIAERCVRNQVRCLGMNPNLSQLDCIDEMCSEFEPETKFH